MRILNNEQGTAEWLLDREGKMTASEATAIGNNGKGLETYIKEIVRKQLSSNKETGFETKDTKRGNELEPVARGIYELERGVEVTKVGFIEYDEYTGCSPDGLVQEEGGLEIKSPDDKNYFEYLLHKEDAVDSGYIWQVQMNLLVTGRKWWDLMIYNPNFTQSYFIFRIFPDQEKIEKLKVGLEKGKQLIIELKNKLK
jgi:YqaJ-like viral recombinase domain